MFILQWKFLFLFLQFLIDSASSFNYFFFSKIFFDKNLLANFLYSLQFLLNLAFLLWNLQTSWGPSFPYFFIKMIFAKFVILVICFVCYLQEGVWNIFRQICVKGCSPEHIKWVLCSMSKFKRKVQGFITIHSIFCQISGIYMVKELNRCYLFTVPSFYLAWKGMTATHLSMSTSFMLWMHL